MENIWKNEQTNGKINERMKSWTDWTNKQTNRKSYEKNEQINETDERTKDQTNQKWINGQFTLHIYLCNWQKLFLQSDLATVWLQEGKLTKKWRMEKQLREFTD